jgi:uncharacterized protein YggT (Ycf19 family)
MRFIWLTAISVIFWGLAAYGIWAVVSDSISWFTCTPSGNAALDEFNGC